jgi:PAS domain S-box-containing protein
MEREKLQKSAKEGLHGEFSKEKPKIECNEKDKDRSGILSEKLSEREEQLKQINEELIGTQRLLEESRDLYADIYDFAPVGLLTLDEKGVIIDVNLTGSNLLKLPRRELVNMPFTVFLKNEDKSLLFSHLNKCKNNKSKVVSELKIFPSKESSIEILLLSTPIMDFKQRRIVFRSAITDLTELNVARHSSFLLSALVESSTDAVFSMNLDEIIVTWNRGAEGMYGYKKHEILGKNVSILIPDEYRKETEEIYIKIRSGEKVKHFETIRRRKNGELIPISKSMSPVKDNEGKIIGISAIARDITEEKRAEAALKESNERFKQLVENINSLFFITSPQRNETVYLSPAYEKMFGKKSDDILANPDNWTENVHPDDRAKVAKIIKNFMANGGFNDYEYRAIKPNGEVRWINVRTFPIRNEAGEIYRVAGIADDVTEERTLARKLRASLIEKDVLMKETHHRVKNNLQVISSLLNLQGSYIKDKRMMLVFHEAKDRIQAIALIHENLYKSQDMSRVDFKNYVELLCTNLFRTYATRPKDVSLEINIDEVLISINRAINLGLVFNELISNSLKYAFPENREGVISIHLHRQNKKLNIVYKDNGVGIPEDIDFKTADSLGMQLINIFIKQLGGEIELNRTEGTEYIISMDAENEKDVSV